MSSELPLPKPRLHNPGRAPPVRRRKDKAARHSPPYPGIKTTERAFAKGFRGPDRRDRYPQQSHGIYSVKVLLDMQINIRKFNSSDS